MNLEHSPTEYSTYVSTEEHAEKAFQRAIIALGFSILKDETISWIDIELPKGEPDKNTTDNGDGRFDLIGETADGNYVLFELKFVCVSKSSSPESTTAQLLRYRDSLVDYAKRLKAVGQRFNLHLNAKHQQLDLDKLVNNSMKLIVAANNKYWDSWRNSSLVSRSPEVEYYKINIENDWFIGKGRRPSSVPETYTPWMPNFTRIWAPA